MGIKSTFKNIIERTKTLLKSKAGVSNVKLVIYTSIFLMIVAYFAVLAFITWLLNHFLGVCLLIPIIIFAIITIILFIGLGAIYKHTK